MEKPCCNTSLPDHYAARSRYALDKYQKKPENKELLNKCYNAPGTFSDMMRKLELHKAANKSPVCIIGAGMAGLYAAMIFQSLEIPYELLEASDRVGGRIYTHRFPNPASAYEYYDVGAMRFPDSPVMVRVFDLVQKQLPLGVVTLIPFIFKAQDTFQYYNKRRFRQQNVSDVLSPTPRELGAEKYVGPDFENATASSIVADVLRPFRQLFVDLPIDQAIKELEKYDQFSVRSYMAQGYNSPPSGAAPQPPIPGPVINFCETMEGTTSQFDRGLVEMVLGTLAFDWPGSPSKWWCFDGGSQMLTDAMNAHLGKTAQFNVKVKALTEAQDHSFITVTSEVNGQVHTKDYNAVISTVPLSRLSVMDLRGCHLSYELWNAIRQLQYNPSIKIGMRFKEPWWDSLPSGSIVGGQSKSDLPVRATVYPSYPPGDGRKSRVLIASYCHLQDAERLGTMINPDGTLTPEGLSLVLRNLADLHDVDVDMLTNQLEDTYAWDWASYKLTMGAFAKFGPQQFNDGIYGAVTQPACNGRLFIAGEATSSAHGWVAGALDSAWRVVEEYLITHDYPKEVKDKFHNQWGKSEYWTEKEMENQCTLAVAHDVEAGL